MLQEVGHECALPSRALRDHLRSRGFDTVLEIDDLVRNMGYERPMALPETDDLDGILVDVKAHRNAKKLRKQKMLWYRINGGKPEHVPGRGDELNPPCPVITPNRWYDGHPGAYSCWPPFYRWSEYQRERSADGPPLCFVHNARGWGYAALFEVFREQFGLRIHGEGSPDGLIPHREVPTLLSRARAYIHLKSSDAPGYALYEAMAAGCPVICTRRLIWKCKMQELLEPGKTCLVFDRPTHDGITAEEIIECRNEVAEYLKSNIEHIGAAGRKRLLELMWTDREGLRGFLNTHFS